MAASFQVPPALPRTPFLPVIIAIKLPIKCGRVQALNRRVTVLHMLQRSLCAVLQSGPEGACPKS